MSLDVDLKLLKYTAMIPRYTSYPTAPHFNEAVDDSVFKSWLNPNTEGQLSLYIHIPFCRQMCWYCGCNTKAVNKQAPIDEYVALLLKEIEMKTDVIKKGMSVTHIHFGGGSPTILSPDQFTHIMQRIKSKLTISDTAEIAIEIDPREISEAKVAAYAQAGVNRASLGVQDFHEHVQKAINRIQPYSTVYKVVETLRAYKIDNISMDLIYGLPHQTEAIIDENIKLALLMRPNRISLFGYAHVPWMKSHMKMIKDEDLPDATLRLKLFTRASDNLAAAGYHDIGLDHFVLEGDEMLLALREKKLKRNFQGYTTDSAPSLIGFGLSSISDTPDGYAQNHPDMRSYKRAIDEGGFAISKGISLTEDDKIRAAIIEQIMCYFTLDLKGFCQILNIDENQFLPELDKLKPLIDDGFVTVDNWTITVKGDARQSVRLVASVFDTYLKPSEQRHAQVS